MEIESVLELFICAMFPGKAFWSLVVSVCAWNTDISLLCTVRLEDLIPFDFKGKDDSIYIKFLF